LGCAPHEWQEGSSAVLAADVHRDPGVLEYVLSDLGLSHVQLELGEKDVELCVMTAAEKSVVHVNI
jgi:hypothetical protein